MCRARTKNLTGIATVTEACGAQQMVISKLLVSYVLARCRLLGHLKELSNFLHYWLHLCFPYGMSKRLP